MSSQLQKPWSLAELARFQGGVSGRVPMAACERLKGLQNGLDSGEVAVSGEISPAAVKATPGLPALIGTASTLVTLTCERCLEQFDYALEASFAVVFVASIGARQDGPDYDFWELDAGKIRLLDVIEEYLLLALPLAVKHAETDCPGESVAAIAPSTGATGKKMHNPFAGLRDDLKKRDCRNQ